MIVLGGLLQVNHDGAGLSNTGYAVNTNADMWTFTYDATTLVCKAYIKGVLNNTFAAKPNSGLPAGELGIGRESAGGARYVNGIMTEVYLADRVISAQDLTRLHNYEKAKYGL